MNNLLEKVGVVVIGRNEGERLKRCLRSIRDEVDRIVYVDSGSTDGSIEFARNLGIDIVELDMSTPFTMARARNAGFMKLLDLLPDTELVQFIDGDCELVKGYLEAAVQTMNEHQEITVVTGRRIERYPNASIYNRLCDLEWGKDLGEIESCGGDMLVRSEAFKTSGMFNSKMIAGEEPELCVRLRKAGGKIVRIDNDMTIHDANIYKFSQWLKRAIRAGHAYAEGCAIHGKTQERHKVREVWSAILWGAIFPIFFTILLISAFWWPYALIGSTIVLFFYLTLIVRIYQRSLEKGHNSSGAMLYTFACIAAKIPRVFGILQYWLNRFRGKQSTLIEYKQTSANVLKK